MALNEKFKTLLGNDYTEEMTAEQVLEKLAEKNIADLSTGDYVSKNKYNDAVKQASKAEKDLNDFKNKQLSAEERAKKEIEDALKAKDDLAASLKAELNKAKVEKVFAGAGLDEAKIGGISSAVTPETAEAIVALMKENTDIAVQKAKEEALKNFKSPDAGKGNTDKAWGEMTLDERTELKLRDPARYNELKNKK